MDASAMYNARMEALAANKEAADRQYPWLFDLDTTSVDRFDEEGKWIQPDWVEPFLEDQELGWGMDPTVGADVAYNLGGFGLDGAQAAGMAASENYPASGPQSSQAPTAGSVQTPGAPTSKRETADNGLASAETDTVSNLPPNVQEYRDNLNGAGGMGAALGPVVAGMKRPTRRPWKVGEIGTGGQNAPEGGWSKQQRTANQRTSAELLPQTTDRLVEEQVARGDLGFNPTRVKNSNYYRRRQVAETLTQVSAQAKAETYNLIEADVPEGTEMIGYPGRKVVDRDGNPVTLDTPEGPIPLVYGAFGRPTVGAMNESGELLVSPVSGRYLTAGISGAAIDAITGQDEFTQSLAHKVWFGDAGEDGLIGTDDDGGWGGGYGYAKAVGRQAFLTLESVKRFADSNVGYAFGDRNNMSYFEYMGGAIANLPAVINAQGFNWTDQRKTREAVGTGWDLGGAGQQQREDWQAQFGVTPAGRKWSIGVGSVRAIGLDPDTGPGSMISGFVDGTALIFLDPLSWVAPEIKLTKAPKALAIGAKQAPGRLRSPGEGMTRWDEAKSLYQEAAYNASTDRYGRGGSYRWFRTPGSRAAAAVTAKLSGGRLSPNWGNKPVITMAEYEIADSKVQDIGRETGTGRLRNDETPGGREFAFEWDDEKRLWLIPEQERVDDWARITLPDVRSTLLSNYMPTDDLSKWTGTLHLSGEEGVRALNVFGETLPVGSTIVKNPPAPGRLYYKTEDLFEQFGVDWDGTITVTPTNKIRTIQDTATSATVDDLIVEVVTSTDGTISITQDGAMNLQALRALGVRNAPVRVRHIDAEAKGAAQALFRDTPQYKSPHAAARNAEMRASHQGTIEIEDYDFRGIDPFFERGVASPMEEQILGAFEPKIAGAQRWTVETRQPTRFSTRPDRNSWLNVELDPAGAPGRIMSDLVDPEQYRIGNTRAIELADASTIDLHKRIRAVHIDENQIDLMREHGTWTAADEQQYRQALAYLHEMGGRSAQQAKTFGGTYTTYRGVGKREGWTTWRKDGIASNGVAPASAFYRGPGNRQVMPHGSDDLNNDIPAAIFADSMAGEIGAETLYQKLGLGAVGDDIAYTKANPSTALTMSNRTLTPGFAPDSGVHVVVAPQVMDEFFAAAIDTPGTRTKLVRINEAEIQPTVMHSDPTDVVRGVDADMDKVPDFGYVVSGKALDDWYGGGTIRPRDPNGPIDEMGEKLPGDVSKRRGNVRVHTDIQRALQVQKLQVVLSKLAPQLGAYSDVYRGTKLFIDAEPISTAQADELVEHAMPEIRSAFGNEIANDFTEWYTQNRTNVLKDMTHRFGQASDKAPALRDPFAQIIERGLYRTVFGSEIDPDDLLGISKWRDTDSNAFRITEVDLADVKARGAKITEYDGDLRVYSEIKQDGEVLRVDPKGENHQIIPWEEGTYREVVDPPQMDLPEHPSQVYRRTEEYTRHRDLSERPSDEGIDPEISPILRYPEEKQVWLDKVYNMQVTNGTIGPGDRPVAFHATPNKGKVAATGRIQGSVGGSLGGTVGHRGISFTLSRAYAEDVLDGIHLYHELERISRNAPNWPVAVSRMVRRLETNFDEVAEASQTLDEYYAWADLLDDNGYEEFGDVLRGGRDLNEGEVDPFIDAIEDSIVVDTDEGFQVGLQLHALKDEAQDVYAALNGQSRFNYMRYRQESILYDEQAHALSLQGGGYSRPDFATRGQDPWLLSPMDQTDMRLRVDDDFDIIEMDLEELLDQAMERDAAVRFKSGFRPDENYTDPEFELAVYMDVNVPRQWREEAMFGKVGYVDPEVTFATNSSQEAFQRSLAHVTIVDPEFRVGGKWASRGEQNRIKEIERTLDSAGFTPVPIKLPKRGAKPFKGVNGRDEFLDEDMIPHTRWDAPVGHADKQTLRQQERALEGEVLDAKAQAGIAEGQTKILIEPTLKNALSTKEYKRTRAWGQTAPEADLAEAMNSQFDATVLGELHLVNKKYSKMLADAPDDAARKAVQEEWDKAWDDEIALAGSKGLWEGNPKAADWRPRKWRPRMFGMMPGQVVLATDPNAALNELIAWSKAMRLDDATKNQLVGDLLTAVTPTGRGSIFEATFSAGRRGIVNQHLQHGPRRVRKYRSLLDDLPDDAYANQGRITKHLTDKGVDEKSARIVGNYTATVHTIASDMTEMWRKGVDEARTMMRDLMAEYSGQHGLVGPDGAPVVIPDTPLLTEMMQSTIPMPEPRELMRATSKMGVWAGYAATQGAKAGMSGPVWMAKTAAGKAYRLTVDKLLENYTNRLFKPLVLARAAYVARVLPEEQARMWANGYVNAITHPVDYILMASGRRAGYTLDGRPFNARNAIVDNEPNLYAEAYGMRFRASNTKERAESIVKSYDRRVANIHDDPGLVEYGHGMAVTLANLHYDPLVRRAAGGFTKSDLYHMSAEVVESGDHAEMLFEWLTKSERGRNHLRWMIENDMKHPGSAQSLQTTEGIRDLADGMKSIVDVYTRGMDDLRDVIATGTYGKAGKFRRMVEGSPEPGRKITKSDRWTDIEPDFAEWMSSRLTQGDIDLETLPPVKFVSENFRAKRKSMLAKLPDALMSGFVGVPTQKMSRAPLFKERYVEHAIDNIGLLSANSRVRVMESEWAQNLTGAQSRRLQAALKQAEGNDGIMYLEDLEMLAQRGAFTDVKNLLYDFSNKTILSDQLRNISPFFTAWFEAIQVWARLFAQNPRVFTRLNRAIQSAQSPHALDFLYNEDERNKAQGAFWKDPNSGDLNFTYPFQMGAPFPLTGRVQNLNMVASLTPGLGPAVTFPASYFTPPDTGNDGKYWLRKMMSLANGGFSPGNDPIGDLLPVPSWGKNFVAAWKPELGGSSTQTLWANAKADATRYLASKDKGALTAADFDVQVDTLARQLLHNRGWSQFTLPTVADHRATAMVQGRLFADPHMIEQSVLSDFYREYTDYYGFNEGNVRFLQDFGESGFVAIGGMNRYDGYMDYTPTQWHFIRKNPDLVKDYRPIIGLISPAKQEGEAFDFDAYRYAQQTGMRQPKTASEYQADMQTRVGYLLIDKAEAGGMSDDQLSAFRDYLHEKLPLFTDYSGRGEDRAQDIGKLRTASQDERVPEDIRNPLARYFQRREQVLLATGTAPNDYNTNWNTKKRRQGAAELYRFGSQLALDEPGFQRAWDYLFSRELSAAVGG